MPRTNTKPNREEQNNVTAEQQVQETSAQQKPAGETVQPVTDVAKETPTTSEQLEKETEKDLFRQLAVLLGSPVENIKEEFFIYQIHKFMSKVGKVVVRYNATEEELEKLFINSSLLNIDGITVSPAYFAVCKRVKSKNDYLARFCSIIDFPFGESAFKAKLASIKDGKSYGVEENTVMMPAMLLDEANIKQFKKQCVTIGRYGISSIALNALDLDEGAIDRAIKAISKTKLSHIIFVFGEATVEEVKNKMVVINKYRGLKKIGVLANVENAKDVSELFKCGADKILTPYADNIGKELLEKFKIKGIKAV